eukprot:COSAG04_NODE_13056_length_622_cov_0.816444_1_plen_91_part_10
MRASRSVRSGMNCLRVCIGGKNHDLPALWLRLNDPAQRTKNGQRLFEVADAVRDPAFAKIVASTTNETRMTAEFADGGVVSLDFQQLARLV